MRIDRIVLASVLCCMLGSASNAFAVDITDCGTSVPPGETGELLADLVCDPDELGVLLENRATLHMNGHSISGGAAGAGCRARCLIEGPGEVFGSTEGIWLGVKRIVVRNVSVHDCPSGGIVSGQLGELAVENVTLTGIHGHAIHVGKLRVTNLSVSDSGAADAYGAIYANGGIRGTNLQSIGNFGIGAFSNGKVHVTGITIMDNWLQGLMAKSVQLTDGTLTNNGIFGDAVDIVSKARPKLENVVCELSRHQLPMGSTEPWGVCATD